LLKATIPAGKSFRLTGVTFKSGTITGIGIGGAIRYRSTGLVQNARIDHCHFDHLNWGYVIQLGDWIYGVEDHNLIECVGAGLSHRIQHEAWGGAGGGNGSWADFPYFGSKKFWFIEDSTIKGSGSAPTSGITDAGGGGRYVVRYTYLQNTSCGGHGTEDLAPRGLRCDQVYNNTFNWTIQHGDQFHRSGNTIWHDNTFLGRDPAAPYHTTLVDYRQTGNPGYNLKIWGLADGANGWDTNDPHGPYLSGAAASDTTITGRGGTFTTEVTMTPNAFRGMELRNENPASSSYLHSALISSNTATTITYTLPFRKPQLVFNNGDAFAVRKVLIALDQGGRGKGDLISATDSRRHYPNQQREPCFSWNNKNTDTNHVYGIRSGMPTIHEGSDYINLGAGLAANQIPAQVQAAYPASVNGGTAYTQEFVYPHPLVSGSTPAPTATASPTSKATATATATATHAFHRAGR